MAVPTITGQYLIDLTNDLLGGYQGSVDSRALMSYINEAKDEIWALLKQLKDDYFEGFTQSTNSSADHYFPNLTSNQRVYSLPGDFHSITWIEVTTQGYTGSKFRYAKANSSDFRNARTRSNTLGTPDPDNNIQEYIYTLITQNGTQTLVLADYPQTTLAVTIWYTYALPDYEMSDTISDILFPFSKKIAEFASQRVLRADQDASAFATYKADWRDSIVSLVQTAEEKNDSDAEFVEDFEGGMD